MVSLNEGNSCSEMYYGFRYFSRQIEKSREKNINSSMFDGLSKGWYCNYSTRRKGF